VFPNLAASPFTIPRGSKFRLPRADDQSLTEEEFTDAVEALPIPLIGVPWFQGQQLLGTLVIGHEAGHDVDKLLGLGPVLEQLIHDRVKDAGRREAWHAWSGEVLADVYGTLAGGPAYVGTLMDFLAGEWRVVAGRRIRGPHYGTYPTRPLRVQIALITLERLHFEEEAARLRADWVEAYPEHEMEEYEADVPTIVDCVLYGPYPNLGCGGLTSLLIFTPEMHRRAGLSAEEIAFGGNPSADDARVLFAAARIAYERYPDDYLREGGAAQTVARVRALRKTGKRRGEEATLTIDRPARNDLAARRLAGVFEQARRRRSTTSEGDDGV
jgi:hypothetical protein